VFGEFVGAAVGASVGIGVVGDTEGLCVGLLEGDVVGASVGEVVGASVGEVVGASVGIGVVGDTEGLCVGLFPASRTGTSERTKQWRERMQGSDKQSKLTLLVGANRMEAHHTYAKAFAEICEEDTEQELAVPVAESIHR
jgi:hypothetical protein